MGSNAVTHTALSPAEAKDAASVAPKELLPFAHLMPAFSAALLTSETASLSNVFRPFKSLVCTENLLSSRRVSSVTKKASTSPHSAA